MLVAAARDDFCHTQKVLVTDISYVFWMHFAFPGRLVSSQNCLRDECKHLHSDDNNENLLHLTAVGVLSNLLITSHCHCQMMCSQSEYRASEHPHRFRSWFLRIPRALMSVVALERFTSYEAHVSNRRICRRPPHYRSSNPR